MYGWIINKNVLSFFKFWTFQIVSDFARTGEIYIFFHSMWVCSYKWGVENKVTDNLKVKTGKPVNDANVAAHARYDDATVAAHNLLKSGEDKEKNVSDDVKIGVQKAVSDAKIAAYEAGSKLEKNGR